MELLDLTGADTVRDCLYKPFLSRLPGLVDAEDVLLREIVIDDALDRASQVTDVDRRDQVLAITEHMQLLGLLEPGIFEVSSAGYVLSAIG